MAVLLFAMESVRFVCIFSWGENKGFAPWGRRAQRSSALHLIFRISQGQIKSHPLGWLFI